jgi:hypothetical protein
VRSLSTIESSAIFACAALAFVAGSLLPVEASHEKSTPAALETIRLYSDDETFCADTGNSGLDFVWLLDRLDDTLFDLRPSSDWDDYPGGRIEFDWISSIECYDMGIAEFVSQDIYFFFNDSATTDSICQGAVQACVYSVGQYWTHAGTRWYPAYQAYHNNVASQGRRRHVINHELGHIFGLGDPFAGNCTPKRSVMHSFPYSDSQADACYGSNFRAFTWPMARDHAKVDEISAR